MQNQFATLKKIIWKF